MDVSVIFQAIDRMTAPTRQMVDGLAQMRQAIARVGAQFSDVANTPLKRFAINLTEGRGIMSSLNALISDVGPWTILKSMISGAISLVSTLWSALWRLGAVFGITSAGLMYMASRWAYARKEQIDFAGQLDISVDKLRGLQYAAEEVGVGSQRLNMALQMLSRNIGMMRMAGAEGGGPLQNFLEKVGDRTLIERLKATSDTAEAFGLVMDAIARQSDSSMKTALATSAFGGRFAAASLVRLAKDRVALEAEYKHFEGMTDTQKKMADMAADRYTRSMLRATAAWEGMKATVLTPIMELVGDYMNKIAEWMRLPANRQLIADTAIAAVKKVAGWVEWLGQPENWNRIANGIEMAFTGLHRAVLWLEHIFANLRLTEAWLQAHPKTAGFIMGGGIGAWMMGSNTEEQQRAKDAELEAAKRYKEDVLRREEEAWREGKAPSEQIYARLPAAGAGVGWPVGYQTLEEQPPTLMESSVLETLKSMGATNEKILRSVSESADAARPVLPEGASPTLWRDLTAVGKVLRVLRELIGVTPAYGEGPGAALRDVGKPTDTLRDIGNQTKEALKDIGPQEAVRAFEKINQSPIPKGFYENINPIPPPFNPIPPGFFSSPMSFGGGGGGGGVMPISFSPSTAGGGGGGTQYYSAMQQALEKLMSTTPAALGANAPVGGVPPTGITIQARGPSVHITQAPPSVNIAVSVNVMNPDQAPAATATAVGDALGRQAQTSQYGI